MATTRPLTFPTGVTGRRNRRPSFRFQLKTKPWQLQRILHGLSRKYRSNEERLQLPRNRAKLEAMNRAAQAPTRDPCRIGQSPLRRHQNTGFVATGSAGFRPIMSGRATPDGVPPTISILSVRAEEA